MARPIKQGLDYFTIDVDFYTNRKVRKIMRACGPNTGTILTCLLCNIYSQKGYYILWDEDLPFDISDIVGIPEGAVTEVLKKALQCDFFDQDMYQKHSILTSEEIQRRFKQAVCKRKEIVIDPVFWVIDGNNPVSSGNNPVNDDRSTQSKVKESKGKDSKEDPIDEGGNAPPHPPQISLEEKQKKMAKREERFYEELKAYLKTYGAKMLRAFYDYWREPNKSRTKMRWENEPTWDLKLRLEKWANNQQKWDKKQQTGNHEHDADEYRRRRQELEEKTRAIG